MRRAVEQVLIHEVRPRSGGSDCCRDSESKRGRLLTLLTAMVSGWVLGAIRRWQSSDHL